jgi:predicted regulator of Ras-like GTPase activity (Roadblock/LC7/MglB family)
MAAAGPVDSVRDTLVTLRDVAGIQGSFLINGAGGLVARDLPVVFDDGALWEVGSRIARLRDTFSAVGDDVDVAVMRFEDHKLYLKIIPAGALCILTAAAVNMPALRMAANLVARRVAPLLERAGAEGLAPREPPSMSPPAAAAAAPPAAHVRRYRGRIVE